MINDNNIDLDWQKFKTKLVSDYKDMTLRRYEGVIILPIKIEFGVRSHIPFMGKTLTVHQVKFSKISSDEVVKKYEKVESFIQQYLSKYHFNVHNLIYLKFQVCAKDIDTAFHTAETAFQEYRSVYNLAIDYAIFERQRYGLVTNLAEYPNSLGGISKDVETKDEVKFYDLFLQSKYVELKKVEPLNRNLKNFNSIFKIARKAEKSKLEKILTECLTFYSNALDSTYRMDCFFWLWRILEVGTNSKEKNNKEIMSLIQSKVQNEVYKIAGNLVVDMRNHFVHRGKTWEKDDKYINWARNYAIIVIEQLLLLQKAGFEEDLDITNFYKFSNMDKKGRDKELKVIKFVK